MSPYNRPRSSEVEKRYSCTLSLTLVKNGVGWSMPYTGLFTPEKDLVPIVQEAWSSPGPAWTGLENLVPTRIRSPDRAARIESLYQLRYAGIRFEYSSDSKITEKLQVIMRNFFREQTWGFHSADFEDSGLLRYYNASLYQLLKMKLLQHLQKSQCIKVPAIQCDIHPIPKEKILIFKNKICVINKYQKQQWKAQQQLQQKAQQQQQ